VTFAPARSALPLESRTYIVTGAGGGIGGAAAARLLRTGANVVGVDLSGRRLEQAAIQNKDLAGQFRTFKANLTDEGDTRAAVQFAMAEFGSVQGLANVAGGMTNIDRDVYDKALSDISLDYFVDTFALNVNSAFLMAKALEAHFYAQGYGKIVNVASLAAFANRPELGNAAYNSAKAAVVGLTQSMSMLMGHQGVRANCVAPGLVISERVAEWIDQGYLERHLAYTALGDLATPADLGEAIAYFLEPQSDAVTGETLRVAAGVR
jgi:NAD(P)-dependent dehydrogenase (short-subunit alcohol dehydrogenase family)